jgi:hypothetical protein
MDQIEAQEPLLFGAWNKQCFRRPPTFEFNSSSYNTRSRRAPVSGLMVPVTGVPA